MDALANSVLSETLITRWSKFTTTRIVTGVDKKLLDVSKLDGGMGLCVNGKPPRRRVVQFAESEKKLGGLVPHEKAIAEHLRTQMGEDYRKFTRMKMEICGL